MSTNPTEKQSDFYVEYYYFELFSCELNSIEVSLLTIPKAQLNGGA